MQSYAGESFFVPFGSTIRVYDGVAKIWVARLDSSEVVLRDATWFALNVKRWCPSLLAERVEGGRAGARADFFVEGKQARIVPCLLNELHGLELHVAGEEARAITTAEAVNALSLIHI